MSTAFKSSTIPFYVLMQPDGSIAATFLGLTRDIGKFREFLTKRRWFLACSGYGQLSLQDPTSEPNSWRALSQAQIRSVCEDKFLVRFSVLLLSLLHF